MLEPQEIGVEEHFSSLSVLEFGVFSSVLFKTEGFRLFKIHLFMHISCEYTQIVYVNML